jgi:hypothetical protein
VQSPDGRWAYTLYASDEPFIHALDTANRTAVCIDLPKAISGGVASAKLALRGGSLAVTEQGQTAATVDLASFKVSQPAPAAPKPRPTPAASHGGGTPWLLWLIPAILLAAVGLIALRRRVPSSGEWSTSSRA